MARVTMTNRNKVRLLGLLRKLRRFRRKGIKDSQLMKEFAFVKDLLIKNGGHDSSHEYWQYCGKYVGEEALCKQVIQAFQSLEMQ